MEDGEDKDTTMNDGSLKVLRLAPAIHQFFPFILHGRYPWNVLSIKKLEMEWEEAAALEEFIELKIFVTAVLVFLFALLSSHYSIMMMTMILQFAVGCAIRKIFFDIRHIFMGCTECNIETFLCILFYGKL